MKRNTHDVYYFLPNKKRPIAHSTREANLLLKLISRDGSTIQQLRDKISSKQILRDSELESVLDAYIGKGFGSKVARDFFRW